MFGKSEKSQVKTNQAEMWHFIYLPGRGNNSMIMKVVFPGWGYCTQDVLTPAISSNAGNLAALLWWWGLWSYSPLQKKNYCLVLGVCVYDPRTQEAELEGSWVQDQPLYIVDSRQGRATQSVSKQNKQENKAKKKPTNKQNKQGSTDVIHLEENLSESHNTIGVNSQHRIKPSMLGQVSIRREEGQ